ncbi:MAG: hypothetical protein J6X12_09930 [Paludibacteraceae bacterium]|nr:hypothetical protein [Paludibacteraceae bacterium]
MEANAFKALRPTIKDPSSYKLISIEAVDSLTEFENINNAIMQHVHMQELTLSLIDDEIKSAEGKTDKSEELKKIDQYFIDVRTDSALISFLDRKLGMASRARVCAIKYVYRFRYLNDAGLMSPGMFYFWAKPDDTVIQLAEKEENLDSAPVSIPGYEELMEEAIEMAILKKDSIEACFE